MKAAVYVYGIPSELRQMYKHLRRTGFQRDDAQKMLAGAVLATRAGHIEVRRYLNE